MEINIEHDVQCILDNTCNFDLLILYLYLKSKGSLSNLLGVR